jgi:hypothetical protein
VRDIYAGIDQVVIKESFAASAVCEALEVSRSGFYAWRRGEETLREEEDSELVPEIIHIFWPWSCPGRGLRVAWREWRGY